MQRNVFSGSEFLLYDINNNPIALSKNCALKVNQKLSDITTKNSLGWTDLMPTIKDWSIEFEGLVSYGTGFTFSYFYQKYNDREPFFIRFGIIQDTFEHTFYGEVAIESIDQSASLDEIVSYSGSLKGIGNLSFTNLGTPEQNGYLKVESDPIFRGSSAFGITNELKTKWNESYDKTLTEIEFINSGNTTTLKTHLRDGSIYSSSFINLGGSGGSINNLSFDSNNGLLSVGNLSTSLDDRYQLEGNYVGLNFLETNFYSKAQVDNTFYPSSNPFNFITSNHTHHTLTGVTVYDYLSIPNTVSNLNNTIWISDSFSSTGSTNPIIGYLNDLQDVNLGSLSSGEALVFNGVEWVNQLVITDITGKANINGSNINQSSFRSALGLGSFAYLNSLAYSDITGKPTTIAGYGITDTYSKTESDVRFLQSEIDTLQSVTSRGSSSSNNVSFTGSLVVPSTSSSITNSIWISNSFSSTGSTGSLVAYLNDLQNVTTTSPINGQALVYSSGTGQWINQSVVSDLSNYYTKSQSDGKYYLSTNPNGYITSSALSPYALSSSIPTNNNQLSNGAGFITTTALNGYALNSAIPTNNNQLSNGAGFIYASNLTPYALLSGANFTGVVQSTNYFYSDYGMYNPTNGLYFGQPIGINGWYLKTGSVSSTNLQIQLRVGSDTIRGYIYADTGGNVGFLNNTGNWSVKAYNGGGELSGNWTTTGNIIGSSGIYGNAIFDNGSRVLSQRGNNYYQVDSWLQLTGNYGIYAPTSGSGTHFNPETTSTYGSWSIAGFRNGYIGFGYRGTIGTNAHDVTQMYDAAGNGGVYNGSAGGTGWHFYWNNSNNCLGLGGAAITNGYKVQVNGALRVTNIIYASSTGYFGGDVIAYYSDERLKEKITQIKNPLAILNKLRGVNYTANDLALSLGAAKDKRKQIGVIAQDFVDLMPEVLERAPFDMGETVNDSKSGEDYMTVKYERIVPLLIEAIKELSAKVTSLERGVN